MTSVALAEHSQDSGADVELVEQLLLGVIDRESVSNGINDTAYFDAAVAAANLYLGEVYHDLGKEKGETRREGGRDRRARWMCQEVPSLT